MSDIVDKGNEAAEFHLSVALGNVQKVAIPRGVGICLNCGADLAHDGRWCDAPCRDEHQQTIARR